MAHTTRKTTLRSQSKEPNTQVEEEENYSDANEQDAEQESSQTWSTDLEEAMNHRIQEAVQAALREHAKTLQVDSHTESSESRTLPPDPKKSGSSSSTGSNLGITIKSAKLKRLNGQVDPFP